MHVPFKCMAKESCLTLHSQEAEPEPNFGLSGKLAAESNKVS